MFRATTLLISLAVFAVGCEQMKKMTSKSQPMAMEDMNKPTPPVQLKQLEPFIGTWEGTAQVVPPANSPAATQPVATYKGGGMHEWALDGMAMKSTGWHEMPNNQKATFIEYMTWDAGARKFRTHFVSDWGDSGDGWMWTDPGGQTYHWTAKGVNAQGEKSSMSGTSTLVDKDTMSWSFVESGPMGKMEMKGTSKRVK